MKIASPKAKQIAASHWQEHQPEFLDFVMVASKVFGTVAEIEIPHDVALLKKLEAM